MSQKSENPGPIIAFLAHLSAILLIVSLCAFVLTGLCATGSRWESPGASVPISIRRSFMASLATLLGSMAMMRIFVIGRYGDEVTRDRERSLRVSFLLVLALGISSLISMARSVNPLDW